MKMNFKDNTYRFLKALEEFEYRLESIDRVWDIVFLDKNKKWNYVRVIQNRETFYINLMDDDLNSLEVKPKKIIEIMSDFGRSFRGSEEYRNKMESFDSVIIKMA